MDDVAGPTNRKHLVPAMTAVAEIGSHQVGPGRHCSPRHASHLHLNDIISRGDRYLRRPLHQKGDTIFNDAKPSLFTFQCDALNCGAGNLNVDDDNKPNGGRD